jgi:hypothetical protein
MSGIIIGENSDWIYVQDNKTGSWMKLIPGRCPQWLPDGTRFYYFLDVGYDGSRCELWSADANGESRLRHSKSDYFIDRSPVVSKDGKKLAYHYSASQAEGGFEKILVICLSGLGEESEVSVVLKEPQFTRIESIAWSSPSILHVIVNGQAMDVDNKCKKKKALHPIKDSEFIDTVKNTKASTLEKGLPDIAIPQWIENTFQYTGKVTWEVNDCGEGGDGRAAPVCVEMIIPQQDGYYLHISSVVGDTTGQKIVEPHVMMVYFHKPEGYKTLDLINVKTIAEAIQLYKTKLASTLK